MEYLNFIDHKLCCICKQLFSCINSICIYAFLNILISKINHFVDHSLGPYVFLTTFSTYLLSKEWYVMEHEFYNGLSLLSIIIYVQYKFGAKIGAFLDKEIDKDEEELNNQKNENIEEIQNQINELEKEKWCIDGQLMLYDVKKQNIWMQLEASYRENLATIHSQVRSFFFLNIDLKEGTTFQLDYVSFLVCI